jgi:hypothetical protein
MSRLIGEMELVPDGPTRIRTRANQPINQSFTVRLSYRGQPLAALPIRFNIVKGQGQLVEQAYTDSRGLAASRVYTITTVDPANTIEARLDLEGMTGQKEGELQSMRQYLERIGATPVHFFVSTADLRILIKVDESNLGEKVSDSFFAATIKEQIARETGATFTNNVGEASFIIEAKVSSTFATMQGNIHFCYGTASVSFRDLKTNEELFGSKVDRVKGYALDREVAGRKAIEMAIKKLGPDLMSFVSKEMSP